MSRWGTSPLVVGHRGGRGEGWPPENTLRAFERARAEGASAIELDVRSCAGKDVVVFHDASLDRMTHRRDARRIEDVSLEHLRRVDLGGASVPTLAETLSWARQAGISVNVEMKHDVPNRATLARETVRIVRQSAADVLLSSFDPVLLSIAAAIAPSIPRALLVHHGQRVWADLVQAAARPPWASAIHLQETDVDARAVERYARRGLRVGTWTVNDPGKARSLALLGVGSIITDSPGAVLLAIGRT